MAHGKGQPAVLFAAGDAVAAANLARRIVFGDIFRRVARAFDKALQGGIAPARHSGGSAGHSPYGKRNPNAPLGLKGGDRHCNQMVTKRRRGAKCG